MEPFIVCKEINDIECLYGRSKAINTLKSCAKRRENVGIIGARRFGKTTLLKSMQSYLDSHTEIKALPIYYTPTNIHKNTFEVYSTLAALLAKKMYESKIIIEEGPFNLSKRLVLDVSSDMLEMKIQISSWHEEYQRQSLFYLVDKLYEKGKYVILLLDEIDSLLLEALGTASDFMSIRDYADKTDKLKIWIAGTTPWKSITSNVGSPELNCGLTPITLSSMEKDDFNVMWEDECSLIEDDILCKELISLRDKVYVKTGGVPFYAKFIGSSFLNGSIQEMPDYSILRDHLCEIYESRFMSNPEHSALIALSEGPKVYADIIPEGITSLKAKGLVEKKDNEYRIVFEYLADYVKAICSNTALEASPDVESKEREMLVAEIVRLWDGVIKAYKTNAPFTPSSRDTIEFLVLEKPCIDDGSLKAFATSLCILYYEGSDYGKRLPSDFYNHDFCKIIRSLRNKNDHGDNKYEARLMDDDRLYSLINNGIVPYTGDHFKYIQSTLLNLFRNELELMLKNTPQNKRVDSISYSSIASKQLEDGKSYEGIIVKVSDQYDTVLKVKCTLFPFPLQINSQREDVFEDEEVIFTAISKPNMKDRSKLFWMADNVHLKN
jgi:hypothetical protein